MNIQQKTEKLYDGVFNFVQNSLSGFLFVEILNKKNMKTKQTITMGPLY